MDPTILAQIVHNVATGLWVKVISIEINFEKKILHGAVTLTVERKLESATHLVSKFLLNDCTFTISGK